MQKLLIFMEKTSNIHGFCTSFTRKFLLLSQSCILLWSLMKESSNIMYFSRLILFVRKSVMFVFSHEYNFYSTRCRLQWMINHLKTTILKYIIINVCISFFFKSTFKFNNITMVWLYNANNCRIIVFIILIFHSNLYNRNIWIAFIKYLFSSDILFETNSLKLMYFNVAP